MSIPERFKKLLARKNEATEELREEAPKRHEIGWFSVGELVLAAPPSDEEALGHLPEELRFVIWLFVMYRKYPDDESKLQQVEDGWESEYDELGLVEELADLAVRCSSSQGQAEKTLAYLGLPQENIQLFFSEEAKT